MLQYCNTSSTSSITGTTSTCTSTSTSTRLRYPRFFGPTLASSPFCFGGAGGGGAGRAGYVLVLTAHLCGEQATAAEMPKTRESSYVDITNTASTRSTSTCSNKACLLLHPISSRLPASYTFHTTTLHQKEACYPSAACNGTARPQICGQTWVAHPGTSTTSTFVAVSTPRPALRTA